MTELKPCPFCGGEAYFIGNNIQVRHTKALFPARCPLLGNVFYDFDANTWNTRHDSELIATQAALKECGEAADKLVKRMKEVYKDPHYIAVWQSYQNHGGNYSRGPQWVDEFESLQKTLSNPLVIAAISKPTT